MPASACAGKRKERFVFTAASARAPACSRYRGRLHRRRRRSFEAFEPPAAADHDRFSATATCPYCGHFPVRCHARHVVRFAWRPQGGRTASPPAADCNQKKDDRTPEEASMKLLAVPYTPTSRNPDPAEPRILATDGFCSRSRASTSGARAVSECEAQ